MITSVSSKMKKLIDIPTAQSVATPEETNYRKRRSLRIIDTAMSEFERNLALGRTRINSVLDLERLVKLILVVSGEGEHPVIPPEGGTVGEDQNTSYSEADLLMVREMIKNNDPVIADLTSKFMQQINMVNDTK